MTKMEQIEDLKQKLCRLDGVASVDVISNHHTKIILTGYRTISIPKLIATVLNNNGVFLKVIWYVKYLDSQCRCGRPDYMHTGDKVIHWN